LASPPLADEVVLFKEFLPALNTQWLKNLLIYPAHSAFLFHRQGN